MFMTVRCKLMETEAIQLFKIWSYLANFREIEVRTKFLLARRCKYGFISYGHVSVSLSHAGIGPISK